LANAATGVQPITAIVEHQRWIRVDKIFAALEIAADGAAAASRISVTLNEYHKTFFMTKNERAFFRRQREGR
jgi:hypothetical protein